MSKIASEIAEALYAADWTDHGLEKPEDSKMRMVESIIDTRLEPVQVALKALYRACDVNDHTVITLDLAESVIALFEDHS